MDNNNLNNQEQANKEQGQFSYQQPYQQQDIYQQQNPYQQQNTYQQQNPYQQPNEYQQQNPYQQTYQNPYQQQYQSDNYDLEEPVSFGDWMLTQLLMYIPCVNLIMLFVWGFGSGTKKSKSNYCKAMLVWTLIGTVMAVFIFIVFVMSVGAFSDYYYYNY